VEPAVKSHDVRMASTVSIALITRHLALDTLHSRWYWRRNSRAAPRTDGATENGTARLGDIPELLRDLFRNHQPRDA
jgi:hypothetical protein